MFTPNHKSASVIVGDIAQWLATQKYSFSLYYISLFYASGRQNGNVLMFSSPILISNILFHITIPNSSKIRIPRKVKLGKN